MSSAPEGSPGKPHRSSKQEGEASKVSFRKKRSTPVTVTPKDESQGHIRQWRSLAGTSTNRLKGATNKEEKESSGYPASMPAKPSDTESAKAPSLQRVVETPPSQQARDKDSTHDRIRQTAVGRASGGSGAPSGEGVNGKNVLAAATSVKPPRAPGATSTVDNLVKAKVVYPQSANAAPDDLNVALPVQNIAPAQESGAGIKDIGVKPKNTMLSPTLRGLRDFDLKDVVRSPRETFSSSPSILLKNEYFTVFVTLATMFFVVVALFLLVHISKPEKKKSFCVTDDCLLHGSLLKETRGLKIDPCHDFSTHVCFNWAPPKEREEITDIDKSAMDDMVFAWLLDIKKDILEGSTSFPVFNKALAMFASCMSDSSTYGSDLKSFRKFLNNISLMWPNPPEQGIGALRVLLSLAYKWQAAFWFKLRVFSLSKGTYRGRRNIVLTPAPLIARYRLMHRAVMRDGKDAYFKYWMGFYKALFGDTTAATRERALTAANIEGDILDTLHGALLASSTGPAMFPISELEVYAPGVSSSQWLKELQHTTALDPVLIQEDVVTTNNLLFLQKVGNLFAKYTNNEILDFLGWQFAQHYGAVSDSTLLVARFGDHRTAKRLRPAFCGYHIEVPYKVLLITAQYMRHLMQTDKEMVDAGFSRLVSTAVRLVNDSTWLDTQSIGLAIDKLRSVNMRLWPPAAFLNETNLEELFRAFPEKEESFGAYFIKSRQSIQMISRTAAYDAVLEMPENYALPYFEYDYLDNAIGVAIAAVDHPLFYSRGTLAMFYGGFGFHLALELVKALDQVGIQWHPEGRLVESFLSVNSQAVFREKNSCIRSTGINGHSSVFPEIPALEIAYSAFLEASNEAENTTQISADLTEEKVFFMTICHMTCSQQGFKNPFAADCNKLMRHSTAFAKAFRCSEGSRMNPRKKCTFFD